MKTDRSINTKMLSEQFVKKVDYGFMGAFYFLVFLSISVFPSWMFQFPFFILFLSRFSVFLNLFWWYRLELHRFSNSCVSSHEFDHMIDQCAIVRFLLTTTLQPFKSSILTVTSKSNVSDWQVVVALVKWNTALLGKVDCFLGFGNNGTSS